MVLSRRVSAGSARRPDIDQMSPGSQPALWTGSPFHWPFLAEIGPGQASGREEPQMQPHVIIFLLTLLSALV